LYTTRILPAYAARIQQKSLILNGSLLGEQIREHHLESRLSQFPSSNKTSIVAGGIGGCIGAAHAGLEDDEVTQIDEFVAIK